MTASVCAEDKVVNALTKIYGFELGDVFGLRGKIAHEGFSCICSSCSDRKMCMTARFIMEDCMERGYISNLEIMSLEAHNAISTACGKKLGGYRQLQGLVVAVKVVRGEISS